MTDERDILYRVHCVRHQAHWGANVDMSRFAWPKTDAEWRQTSHGAPWDSNVEMARVCLRMGNMLFTARLLDAANTPSTKVRDD